MVLAPAQDCRAVPAGLPGCGGGAGGAAAAWLGRSEALGLRPDLLAHHLRLLEVARAGQEAELGSVGRRVARSCGPAVPQLAEDAME